MSSENPTQHPKPVTQVNFRADDPHIHSILRAAAEVIDAHNLENEIRAKLIVRHSGSAGPRANSNEKSYHREEDDDKKKPDDENQKGEDKKEDKQQQMSPEKKRRFIIIGAVVALIVVVGSVLFWMYARQYETTDDAFIDGHVSQISPQVSGRIQSLLVEDNQEVEAGQVLAEINPRDYQENLAEVEAKSAQATAQLELERANVMQAETNVVVAEADAVKANQDLKRYQSVDQKAITQQQLDTARAQAHVADAKLEASRQQVEAVKAQVATAEANVRQAEAGVSAAKLQLSYTKITAPIAGKVTKRTVEVGNVVSSGQPLLAVVSDDLWITANYKETQLDLMREGQPVRIKVDAFPDVVFSGHIESFQKGSGSAFSTLPAENATGNFVKVVQRVPVKIVFDDAQQRDQYPLALGLSVMPRVTVR